MSTPSARLSLVFILAAIIGLSGCGKGQATPPGTPPTASRYVAVARGSIDVEGGMLPLSSAVPGVIARVVAHVGDRVHQGQVLATLDDGDARAALDIAKGKLDQAKAQAHMIALRLKAARHRAHTLAEAAAAGADAGQNATDAGQPGQPAGRQPGSGGTPRSRWHAAQLERARHALALHTLRAPVAAEVTQVKVQPGESVSAQSGPLFTLLPDAPRIVTAEINSDFVATHPQGHAGQGGAGRRQ